MRRREFITLLGGAAAGWPIMARAQQSSLPVIGLLVAGTPEAFAPLIAAFRKGLNETGFVEGQSVAIEYRWANNENNRLPELAADLVRRRVAVIVTPVSTAAALAAKAATTTIPVVFSAGADPVQAGLVASLNRPGGNFTGVHFLAAALGAKRLGLLHELRPEAARFALLVNPNNPVTAETMIKDVRRRLPPSAGKSRSSPPAPTAKSIPPFKPGAKARRRAPGHARRMFLTRRVQLVTLATRHALPAIYPLREFVEAGGLMSYGSNKLNGFARSASTPPAFSRVRSPPTCR